MRGAAMFDQIDPLPCAQHHPPLGDGDLQADRQDRGLEMGGHVVGPFGGMGQPAHRGMIGRRRQPVQPAQQIALHVWIGVFLNQQAA